MEPEQVQNSTFTKRSNWDAEYLYYRHGLFNHSKSKKKRLKIKIDDSLKLYWLMLQNEAGVTFFFFFVLIFDDPAQTY